MIYRAIGVMSGSSLDGMDIVFAEFQEQAGQWTYEIIAADCYSYDAAWQNNLKEAILLPAMDYQLLHTSYGKYTGEQLNHFIEKNGLQYKVALIASHGHTSFHLPTQGLTAQLGDGAAIAAQTNLPVVSDLRAMDVAFGGQGAPIVPVGEKFLLPEHKIFLNIGGIANISFHGDPFIAFDVCPANRVLNMIANETGEDYDKDGIIARQGDINDELLGQLNDLKYYAAPPPKSLSNDFGINTVFSMLMDSSSSQADIMRTYVEHIAMQVAAAFQFYKNPEAASMLVTGGGALNIFLVERLKAVLEKQGITIIVPDEKLVKFKEALIMAFLGVRRWREEYTVASSITGASRNSIGGALWNGHEA
jgi:anhydro-N-acetylmuramic acid kinase